MATEKITMAWCHPGQVEGMFLDSVVGSLLYDANTHRNRMTGKGAGTISLRTGPRIAEGRNQVVEIFLKEQEFKESRWLVMVDTDMVWQPWDVHNLVEAAEVHDFGVLGGLCFAGADTKNDLKPTIFVITGHDDEGRPVFEPQFDYPRNMIVECDATGAAFIAIRRDVLLHMQMPHPTGYRTNRHGKKNPYIWFVEGIGGERQVGEDVAFCHRVRALGYRVGVHTGIKIGHVKRRVLDEELFDSLRAGAHDDGGFPDHAAPVAPHAGGASADD